jgi:hypothetical protein
MSKNDARTASGQSGRKGKTGKSLLRPFKRDFFLINFEGLLFKDLPYHLDFYRDDKGSS